MGKRGTAMNTAVDTAQLTETVEKLGAGFSWEKLLHTLLLLLVCVVVIRIVMGLLDRGMKRLEVERSLYTFVRSALRVGLWLIAATVVLGYLGIPMSSLITVLGVVGLAVSLAIQDTLANLAGGIMLLASKPFKAGDYIEAGGVEGTVDAVGLVYTKMTSIDNKLTVIPNGEISKSKITNYTAMEKRRVDLKLSLSYDADCGKVKETIQKVIGSHPKALFTPQPFVRVSAYGASAIEYTVRVWCATEDYWDLYFDLLEQLKAALDREGLEMTYEHLNVHLVDR